uniref:Chemokine interleukin-8-like domain-containing protein n=1 Tax=Sus scrofa TaxID=9823 RepID=A0A4X1T541_PIG
FISLFLFIYFFCLFAISLGRSRSTWRFMHPPNCCFTYTSRKIPYQYAVAYFKTSGQCPTPAIM